MVPIDEKQRVYAAREAQKRLSWIDNVKRKLGYDQEKAESEWLRIFDTKQSDSLQPSQDNKTE